VLGVKYSPALRWSILILLLLPLTIAWKLAIKPENPIEIQDAIIEFLASQKFDVTVTQGPMDHMPIIEASSASCSLRVMRVSPFGDEANFVHSFAGSTDHIFFVFRRSLYTQQPVRLTTASYLWFRFLFKLGLVSRTPPVIAVASSCNAEQLPWSVLRAQDPL
jgi:hypothetical protein